MDNINVPVYACMCRRCVHHEYADVKQIIT